MLGELGIKGAVVDLVQIGLAAGATDSFSSSVDMAGFGGCLFVGIIGAQDATATAALNVQHSDDNQNWTYCATAYLDTPQQNQDDKLIVIDVQKPRKRYLRCELDRNGTTTWGGTIAIRYLARGTPVPLSASYVPGTPIQAVSDPDFA
jgi:hypothetical protein